MVIISRNSGKITVRAAGNEVATAQAAFSNDVFKEYYVGGIPEALRTR